MIERIEDWFKKSAFAQQGFLKEQSANLQKAAELIAASFNQGGKLLIMGNGGSAADAQHMAAEFVNRFKIERPPLPALALTTDTSILTSISNDYSFDEIFVKQIKALGAEGDVVLGISTSGNSSNVIEAIREAGGRGLTTLVLTGGDGGILAKEADLSLCVPVDDTPVIQEVHLMAEHLICSLVDAILFLEPGGALD